MRSSEITELRKCTYGRRISHMGLFQLVLFVVLSLGLRYAYSQTDNVRSQLGKSFEKWDENWDKQVAGEFVDEIIHLANLHTGGLSEVQLREITDGLSGMQNVEVVTELTHPLEKEMYRQYLRYGITNYLILEPGDKQQQAQLLQQLNSLLGKCEKNLRDEFPGFEDIISKAVEHARSTFTKESKNPLRRDLKRPVNPELIKEINKRWTEELVTLKAKLTPDLAIDRPFQAEAQIGGAILTSLYLVNKHTQLQVLPRPKELIEAENNFLDNVRLIWKWREEKSSEIFRESREKIKIEQMVKQQLPNDEFYLNQVEVSVNLELIDGPDVSNGSEANDGPGAGESGEEILSTHVESEADDDKQSNDEEETDNSRKNLFRSPVIADLRTAMISAGIFVFLLALLVLLYVKRTRGSKGEI